MNQKALEIIKEFEGCKLKAYKCSAGVATIGYGTTTGVKMGDTCTQQQADKWLQHDVDLLTIAINNHLRIILNENQQAALISFAYNVGMGALNNSTLMKKLNQGDIIGASNEFLKWDKATVNGKKVALAGLTRRRKAERELFLL